MSLVVTCRKDFRAGLLKSPSPSAWTRVVERWWPDCDMDRLLRKRDLHQAIKDKRERVRNERQGNRMQRRTVKKGIYIYIYI